MTTAVPSGPLGAALAATRFGLGPRPDELATIGTDPRGWLRDQIDRPGSAVLTDPALPTSLEVRGVVGDYLAARARQRRERQPEPPPPRSAASAPPEQMADNRRLVAILAREARARTRHGLATPAPFAERWALFWANHFTVAARQLLVAPWIGAFEREAIRPHVFGRFADLLVAATLHPGMLAYLDQAQSMGPNAPMAQAIARRPRGDGPGRTRGLNENLAREVLELHTLGAPGHFGPGGYSQADVTELARALTGWTIQGPRLARFGAVEAGSGAVFVEAMHEPGPRTLLGASFGGPAQQQAPAILEHLATRPATARHIATRLAIHFVADDPPPALVSALETVFRSSGGDLSALARALIDSPLSWETGQRKFKTPNEFFLSSLRAIGLSDLREPALRDSFDQLGQPLFRAPSPRGWADTAESWAGPDAILKRADWAGAVAQTAAGTTDPRTLLDAALGPLASARTREAVRRAGSPAQAITLALMSPEFQRR